MRKGILVLGLLGVAALGVAAVAATRAANGPQGEALRRQAMIAAFRARQAATKARDYFAGGQAQPAREASSPGDGI